MRRQTPDVQQGQRVGAMERQNAREADCHRINAGRVSRQEGVVSERTDMLLVEGRRVGVLPDAKGELTR